MRPVIRRKELGDLRTLLSRHHSVALTGGIGTGRRSLLRALEADWEGIAVRVPSSPLDAQIAYSGIDGLLTAVGAPVDDVAIPAERTLDEVALSALTALDALPEEKNMLVLVPNADEMDLDSQRVLGRILRRRRTGPLSIVITARSVSDDGPFASVPEIALSDLSIAELVDLAHELSAVRFGHLTLAEEAALVAAHAASGRPLALSRILDEMALSEIRGEIALTLPVRVGPASHPMIAELVDGTSPDSEEILRCLSLAPLTPVRPLADRMPGFWEAIDELESRGAIERRGAFLRIPHGLVRASVQQSMSAGQRRRTHLDLAQDCAETWPQVEAWHTSFVAPDEETPELLTAHATGLIRQGFVACGIEFVERALKVSAAPERLHERILDVAEALADRGQFVFARRYSTLASRSSHPGIAVRARTLDVRNEFVRTQTLPSSLLMPWSRREAAEAPAEVARLQLTLALCHCERGEYADAQELVELAEAAQDSFHDGERQLAQAVRILLESNRGDDASALRGFIALQEEQEAFEPTFGLAVASGLMLTEHYDRASAVLDRVRMDCEPSRTWRRQADCLRAELEIRLGRIRRASDVIDRITAASESEASRGSGLIRQDRLLLLRCWHLFMSGRPGDAGTVEEEAAALAMTTGNRSLLAELNAVQGRYLLSVDCPAEAVDHLRRCAELSGAEVNPNVRRFEGDLIEALVRLGRREHASVMLQQLRRRADRCPSRWTELAVSRSEAMLAAGTTCTELFGRALREASSPEFAFEKALTHAAFASRLADNGAGMKAREQRTAAAALLHEAGAERLAEQLLAGRTEAAEIEALPDLPRLGELSDEERKVVELVRMGLKNREIAERIFVSLRTVELRLTAVYRKLDVGSRTELVSRLAGNPRLAAV
ncbi:LuxR C-terminal-related transcriptional regulator [Brevibacterium sp. SMBL_HHYL_HB1]|uniref:LuxR C-terminal-related transcriptional regulator n=1 Tax=Brevibacterium sp. SMBL_HHYL_HB1 TaxID=2777556 RepID=UPI001BAD3859|nr:LuxR C-terminal-related transcriptional regulator [Brevibacterium sp. SMBL_HHYL_HB1]QUL79180.1 response regulator transcription factor [Brevibacterium sp. SMBL_HHYL_HB1]